MTLWTNGKPNIFPKTWTKTQIAFASRGLHPANGMPLAEQKDDTWNQCRNCQHAQNHEWRTKTYWKCALNTNTHGPGTDIRLNWPACTLWEPA